MALRVEEDFHVHDVLSLAALQIGPGQVVKILLLLQHGHALIVDIKKVLQAIEFICFAN
jgi:hypothetical protein